MSDKIDDPLKSIADVTKPDIRQRYFNSTLGSNHSELANIELHPGVPAEVRQLFETAKNLSLYSWFVYRFHQVSELIAFSALEMALRLRYESEAPEKIKRIMTLYPLIQYAKANQWITNEGFPSLENRAVLMAGDKKNHLRSLEHDFGIESEMRWEEPTQEEIAEAMKEFDLVDSIASNAHKIRNNLAHGSTTLLPNSVTTLFTTAEVINQLYD